MTEFSLEEKIAIINKYYDNNTDDAFHYADLDDQTGELPNCNTVVDIEAFAAKLYKMCVATYYVTPKPYRPSIKQRIRHFLMKNKQKM